MNKDIQRIRNFKLNYDLAVAKEEDNSVLDHLRQQYEVALRDYENHERIRLASLSDDAKAELKKAADDKTEKRRLIRLQQTKANQLRLKALREQAGVQEQLENDVKAAQIALDEAKQRFESLEILEEAPVDETPVDEATEETPLDEVIEAVVGEHRAEAMVPVVVEEVSEETVRVLDVMTDEDIAKLTKETPKPARKKRATKKKPAARKKVVKKEVSEAGE